MDWNKIGALGTIGCLIVAGVTLGIELGRNHFNPWYPLAIVAIGGCLFYSLVLLRSLQRIKALPFYLLSLQCSHILSEYRKLAFDYPADVRHPLNGASWPDYGQVWQHQHVELYRMKLQLFEFLYIADTAYKRRGIASYPGPFNATVDIMIVDLIDALEALETDLEQRR